MKKSFNKTEPFSAHSCWKYLLSYGFVEIYEWSYFLPMNAALFCYAFYSGKRFHCIL